MADPIARRAEKKIKAEADRVVVEKELNRIAAQEGPKSAAKAGDANVLRAINAPPVVTESVLPSDKPAAPEDFPAKTFLDADDKAKTLLHGAQARQNLALEEQPGPKYTTQPMNLAQFKTEEAQAWGRKNDALMGSEKAKAKQEDKARVAAKGDRVEDELELIASQGGLPGGGIRRIAGPSFAQERAMIRSSMHMMRSSSELRLAAERERQKIAAPIRQQMEAAMRDMEASAAELKARARSDQALDKMSELQEKAQMSVDPNRWFANKSTVQKVFLAISAAFSGFGAGVQGKDNNPMMDWIEQQIDKDTDIQKYTAERASKGAAEQMNLYSAFMGVYRDERSARIATNATKMRNFATLLSIRSAHLAEPQLRAQLMTTEAGLMGRYAKQLGALTQASAQLSKTVRTGPARPKGKIENLVKAVMHGSAEHLSKLTPDQARQVLAYSKAHPEFKEKMGSMHFKSGIRDLYERVKDGESRLKLMNAAPSVYRINQIRRAVFALKTSKLNRLWEAAKNRTGAGKGELQRLTSMMQGAVMKITRELSGAQMTDNEKRMVSKWMGVTFSEEEGVKIMGTVNLATGALFKARLDQMDEMLKLVQKEPIEAVKSILHVAGMGDYTYRDFLPKGDDYQPAADGYYKNVMAEADAEATALVNK